MHHLASILAVVGATIAHTASVPGHTSALEARQESWPTWCGAVKKSTVGKIQSVEGAWTVPSVSIPPGGNTNEDYWVYHWVGIDGSYGCNSILQAGTTVDLYQGRNRVQFWYEFYPDPPVFVSTSDLALNINDNVFVKVTASSARSGTIFINNVSTGKYLSIPISLQGSGGLCFISAAWVAEDPHSTTKQWPLASFTSSTISDCKAITFDGAEFGLNGADIGNMVQNGKPVCKATKIDDWSVSVSS